MTLNIDSDVIETDKIKAYEDSTGTVVLEDKVNDNQVELDDDVTMADVASHLAAGDNPHTTTLEQARSEDNQLSGAVDADGNDVTNVAVLGADSLNNIQYVGSESELHDAGDAVDSSTAVDNIVVTSDIRLSTEFHPPTNSKNGVLWVNGKELSIASGVNENVVHIEGGSGWEVRGPGIIDGNKSNQTDQNDSSLLHGINIRACQQPVIKDVTVRNTLGDGMNVGTNATDALIQNCRVRNAGDADYQALQTGGIRVVGGDDATVSQCVFEDCYGHWAIVTGANGDRIRGPSMTECVGDGLQDPEGPQGGFLMIFCDEAVMSNCSGRNVSPATSGHADVCRVEDFYDGVVEGCVGVGSPDAGVRLGDDTHDSVMVGCVGSDSDAGLVIGAQTDSCSMVGCRADRNNTGIDVLGGTGHFVAYNHVENNTTALSDAGTGTTVKDNKGDHVRLVQTGSFSHDDPGTAADGTWDSWTTDQQTVSFDTEFGETPTVVASLEATKGAQVEVRNVSTTGFRSDLIWYRSDASTGRTVYWVAVGQE